MNVLLSIIVGGVMLFLWNGLAQNVLPWGIKSVKQHVQKDEVSSSLAQVTTNGMVYVKGHVAAFVAIKPESYYSMGRYFAVELLSQFCVAAVITAVLVLTGDLPDMQRLLVVVLVGVGTIASVDLPYWNWWGFSTRYTLGVAVNRLVGYVITGWVLVSWLL